MPSTPDHPAPLPCKSGCYQIPKKRLAEWVYLYPRLDVHREIEKMRGWLESRARNRKTHRGMLAFVQGWLNRADRDAQQSRLQETAPVLEDGKDPNADVTEKRFALLTELNRDKSLTHGAKMRILDERYPIR